MAKDKKSDKNVKAEKIDVDSETDEVLSGDEVKHEKKPRKKLSTKEAAVRIGELHKERQEKQEKAKDLGKELGKVNREVNDLTTQIEKLTNILMKKGRGSDDKKERAPSGFTKPQPVPEKFVKFFGWDKGVEKTRPEITSSLWNYVKDNNLTKEGNGKEIKPDKALRKLFGLTDKDTMNFSNIQKHIASVFNTDEAESSSSDSDTKSKSKSKSK